jgi:hypothetical protein
MIWVLIWFQLTNTQGVEYYQLNTFTKKDECIAALDDAQVLIRNNSEAVACLEVIVK